MRIFQVDNKHQQTISEFLEVEINSDSEKEKIVQILRFINKRLNRYQQFELAKSMQFKYNAVLQIHEMSFDDAANAMEKF